MNNRDSLKETVTLFLGDLAMGGAERVFVTLARLLVQRGHRVEIILAHKSGPLLDELDPAVQIIDLGAFRAGESPWRFGMRSVFNLVRHLRRNPPQVVLTTLTGANLVCLIAKWLSGHRFRLVIREAVTIDNVQSPVRLRLMRWLYPAADQIIALTAHMKDEMASTLKIPLDKLTVIGNMLDSERIGVLAQDNREQHNINELSPYIIAVGRLSEQKDFATLIRAMSKLPPTAPNLVIIGEGPQRTALESLVKGLVMEGRVHLLGFRSNPYPWLQAAQGFVLSSRWEGYPNALLEALHFGLPVVVSEYDRSIRSLLAPLPLDRYRLVPVGHVQELAGALREIIMSTQGGRKDGEYQVDPADRLIEQYELVLGISANGNDY